MKVLPGQVNADSEIIQIGAGFAGLRCADVLSQKGLKVTILEGRDRIGGRVSRISRQAGPRLMKAGLSTISCRSRIRFVGFHAAQFTTIYTDVYRGPNWVEAYADFPPRD